MNEIELHDGMSHRDRQAARRHNRQVRDLALHRNLPDAYLKHLRVGADRQVNAFGLKANVLVNAVALQSLVDAVLASREAEAGK